MMKYLMLRFIYIYARCALEVDCGMVKVRGFI